MSSLKHSLSELRETLSYDPNTGEFRRVSTPSAIVGKVDPQGYLRISVNGRYYYAHRLAWLFVNGDWPGDRIDHIDRDRANNRIGNLRVATASQNAANAGPRKSNTSGFTGVSVERGKFVARIAKTFIGSFMSPDEASAAYLAAARARYGNFAGAA